MRFRIPTKFLIPQFESWKRVLISADSGHIFFLPYSGWNYRLVQFKLWLESTTKKRIKLVKLEDIDLEDEADTIDLIGKNQYVLVIARDYLYYHDINLLDKFDRLLIEKEVGALFFHETIPSCIPAIREKQTLPPSLARNNFHFPLSKPIEVERFIYELARDWNTRSLTAEDVSAVIKYVGGYLFLAKQVMREVRDFKKDIKSILAGNLMSKKIDLIWRAYPAEVKETLDNLLVNVEPDQLSVPDRIVVDLEAFRLIKFSPSQQSALLPLFLEKEIQQARRRNIVIRHGEIIFNGQSITPLLSRTQRKLLKTLLIGRKQTITRDQLAISIWGKEWMSKYSDWAIDQHIRRLRLRLNRLSIPIQISTKRGDGYKLI